VNDSEDFQENIKTSGRTVLVRMKWSSINHALMKNLYVFQMTLRWLLKS